MVKVKCLSIFKHPLPSAEKILEQQIERKLFLWRDFLTAPITNGTNRQSSFRSDHWREGRWLIFCHFFRSNTKLIFDLLGHSKSCGPMLRERHKGGKTVANMAHDSTAQRRITFSAIFIKISIHYFQWSHFFLSSVCNLNGCPPWQQDSTANTPSIISGYGH